MTKSLFNNLRMNLSDTRRLNLMALLKGYDSDRAFSESAGLSPGFLSQLKMGGDTPGGRNIGEKLARRIERNLGLDAGSLDSQDFSRTEVIRSVDHDPGAPLVRIPWLAATLSMGNGISSELAHDQQIRSFETTRQWIRARLSRASSVENIRIVTGYGDSMRGTFNDGDALFVDTGVKRVDIDAIFALQHDNELFIKRVQRLPGGAIRLISDNRVYDPIIIEPTDAKGFQVVGRVIGTMNFNEL